MATQTVTFPAPGDVFENRYRIERLIGSGGFSRVYLATQTDLGRRVALKVMLAEKRSHSVSGAETDADSHGLAERFLQEARVVSKLRDPHTVTVHDHGRTSHGHFFMVLEFIDGETLSEVIRAEGAMDPKRVAKILEQTLESLQEAHMLGLLHRDVKPANIMLHEHLGRRDNVKVLDFGIAKFVSGGMSEAEDITKSGSILGTPRYMSPEQLRGETIGPGTDIYSLGLVAYEMLVGKKAIDSNSSVIIIGQQLAGRSFAVPNLKHIPARLRMIVNRMLSKDLDERYPNAEAVLSDLQLVTSGSFPDATRTASRVPNLTPMEDLPDLSDSLEFINVYIPPVDEAPEPIVTRRAATLLGVLLLVSVVVVVLGIAVSRKQSEPEVVIPPPVREVVEAPSKVDPAEDQPKFDEMTINTGDVVAKIFINGKPSGDSPVVVTTADVNLPLRIRAVAPGGGERMVVLDSLVASVNIDLTELAAQATPVVTEPVQVEKPTPRVRVKPVVKPAPDPTPDPKKLTLPALDY